MPIHRDQLYVCLHLRSQKSRKPGQEDSYHWALLRGPHHETRSTVYTRYHARNEPTASGAVWAYETHPVTCPTDRALLVRVCVAKINDPAGMEELFANVPVFPEEQPEWNCRAWVRTALEALDVEEKVLGPRMVEWQRVTEEALRFVKEMKERGCWDGRLPFDPFKPPTKDLVPSWRSR